MVLVVSILDTTVYESALTTVPGPVYCEGCFELLTHCLTSTVLFGNNAPQFLDE